VAGVLLILAGAGLYGEPPANEALLCVQEPSHLSPNETIRNCTAAIQAGGPSADVVAALMNRCKAYRKKGDYARALADSERAIQLDPQSAVAVCGRGWVRFDSGDLDRAMLDFEQALILDPDLASAYRGRAGVYATRAGTASNSAISDEQYDQAIRNLGEALRLKPDGATYYKRGWCYFQKHSYNSAIEDLDEAIRRNSGAQAYYYRGWCHIYKEDFTEAIADFDQAILLDPKFAGAYKDRAWVHNRQREYHRAIQDYSEAIRLHPDNDCYRGRAWANYYSGSYVLSLRDTARASWRVWPPIVLAVVLIYIFGRLRKAKQTEPPAKVSDESPAGDDPEPCAEYPDVPIEALLPRPPISRHTAEDADLDVLIRTGLRDRIAIGMAEGALREAAIPFFVMDQNVWARQESGNFMAWWNIRVPHEREAEAREIIRAVEEMK